MSEPVLRRAHGVLDPGVELGGNVLDQRAAQRHIQHLHAAADGEEREVGPDRGANQRHLEGIAAGFGGAGFARFSQIFDGIGYKPGWFWVLLVALTELVGGLMLVFGFFTRFAALAVVIFMINAVWFTSAKGFFWTAGGSEFSILLLAVALVFMIRGGGECSIDAKMSKEL